MGTKLHTFKSFQEFWPYYLAQHQNRINRRLHLAGTILGWTTGLILIINGYYFRGLFMGLLIGYSLAWIGHFVFEKNKPATFQHPFYSFAGDIKMCWFSIIGKNT